MLILMISKATPQACIAVRSIGTLSMLLGAPPSVLQQQDSDSLRTPEQQPQQQQEQPGNELPVLCGEPKNKVRPKQAVLMHRFVFSVADVDVAHPIMNLLACALQLSLHRRGNRRVSYYARRKELFAHCK